MAIEHAEKLSITLPAGLARAVRAKVETGAYASNSEVIREALRFWQEREIAREQRLAGIRQSIAEAIDDPRPSVPAAEVFDGIRALHRQRVGRRRKVGGGRRHGA